jgi:2-dehydro-3-deoxyphosphooctonate aldolase (KDO 8-P synthase)
MGRRLQAVAQETGVRIVYKSSYDKANRSSRDSFRGPGLREGLEILAAVKAETGLPVISDVHEPEQAEAAAKVLDVLQIPAFLSRQTDLLVAAARTGKPVNVKKGQFLAPDDMAQVVEKIRAEGNENVLLCERGSSFGYHNLVVDMRSFPMMRALGFPIVYDVTHSLQLPGGGKETGGLKQYAPALARAAAATGAVDGFFLEVHDRPDEALSDRSTQLDVAAAAGGQAGSASSPSSFRIAWASSDQAERSSADGADPRDFARRSQRSTPSRPSFDTVGKPEERARPEKDCSSRRRARRASRSPGVSRRRASDASMIARRLADPRTNWARSSRMAAEGSCGSCMSGA